MYDTSRKDTENSISMYICADMTIRALTIFKLHNAHIFVDYSTMESAMPALTINQILLFGF